MKSILSQIVVAAFLTVPMTADSIGTVNLTGTWDTLQTQACQGTTTCNASYSQQVYVPQAGTVTLQGTMAGTAGLFAPSNSPHHYGLFGELIPNDAYVLRADLQTSNGFDYGTHQNPNPDLKLSGWFDIPKDSGDWNVTVYFWERGDGVPYTYPQDSVDFKVDGVNHNISNTCSAGISNYYNYTPSCTTAAHTSFSFSHTVGVAGDKLFFDTAAAVQDWGTDMVTMEAIFQDPQQDLSPTPEPASVLLLLGGGLFLVTYRRFSKSL